MDKDQARKDLNAFLDSASDQTVMEFLEFMKERRDRKRGEEAPFNKRGE